MKRRWWPLFLLVGVLPYLWVLNCSGPRPELESVRLRAPDYFGGTYRVTAIIRNTGPGHGQAAVTITLRNNATGQTYQKDDAVTLAAGETVVVSEDIEAPLASYTPNVAVEYPPR
ncbi:MAG: hypothetical protein IVW57_03825 [Ktedonobacterales bacterium]|nr:hypothetical protein [Ktedonobacterales bacterium]